MELIVEFVGYRLLLESLSPSQCPRVGYQNKAVKKKSEQFESKQLTLQNASASHCVRLTRGILFWKMDIIDGCLGVKW
jgi:hypothetical protein